MKHLIQIETQTLVMEFDGDPDQQHVRLSRLNYRATPVPVWKHGQTLVEKFSGDVCYYIGPTENAKRAVVQFAGCNTSHAQYVAREFSELEPVTLRSDGSVESEEGGDPV